MEGRWLIRGKNKYMRAFFFLVDWNLTVQAHRPCLFRLLAVSGHQKLLRTTKRSAFQPTSIKFVGAKTI
jgi:hypothetical protein